MLHQNILQQKDKPNLFYVVAGTEDYVDDHNYPRATSLDDRVYAKAVADKPTKHFNNNRGLDYRYYIRMSPNRQLINPIEILSTVKDKPSYHYINSVCKSEDSFQEVTPFVFSKYITYLQTKDIRWFKEAQREIE